MRTIRNYIEKEQLLQPSDKVIVALSGGADSVALLCILLDLGYKCVAAHCNFHLRDAESDGDEMFVRSLCERNGVQLFVKNFDTKAYAKEQKISIEMAARDLRYAWFHELMTQQSAQAVAVAHHADDQLETILLNLVRGAGLRGMSGMKPRNGHIIRPLLTCSREALEQYLTVKKQDYRTDSTNAETIFKRNKIRHQIIPLLEELNPNVRNTIVGNARHISGYSEMVQQMVANARADVMHEANANIYIDIPKLLHCAGAEVLLFELLQPYGFSSDVVEQIFVATQGISGKQFFAPDYTVLKDRDFLIIYPNEKQIEGELKIQKTIRERLPNEQFPTSSASVAFFDADKLPATITLRSWQLGDKFAPIGMGGKMKKLSDFFSNQKFTLQEKQSVQLLASDNAILWIVGHRISDKYKVDAQTKFVAEISIRK